MADGTREADARPPAGRRRSRRPRTIIPRGPQPGRRSRPSGPSRRRLSRRGRDAATGWAMITPSVVLIGVFGLVPVVWSFVLSFQRNDLQTPAQWVGFKNYRQLAHDPVFRDSVKHTLVYTGLFVPITLVLSLLAAAALNRRIRGITVYRLAVFIPVVTSTIATGVIFTWLMDPDFGLINAGLHKVGLPTFGFFSSPSGALPAVVIMTVWGWVGFGALIFLAGLQGIPQDLIEAAQIDGCSKRGAFWRIQVPLLRPVTGFLFVWLTINSLQLFDEVYATTKGGPLHSTTVVVYYLYEEAFRSFHAGYAAAIAVVLFVAIAAITIVQLRLTREASATGKRRS
jgi:multiple sugar transport system permease protein